MSDPQVSVVMSVYNAERYVAQAVESILDQTLQDFEFLIFDDGSNDRSPEILKQYAVQDRRISLFAKEHKGYTPWLNEGIRLARGEFIARMDADDLSLPHRFARQVKFLDEFPECVAVGCDMLLIDPDGAPICDHKHDVDHNKIEADLMNGGLGVIDHPTSMIRRVAIISVGGYRQEYESIEDFDLWLRLAEHGRLANLPEVLFKYRQHHESVNATQVERQKRWADHIVNEARLRRGLEPLSRSIWNNYVSATSTIERHLEWAMSAAASGHRRTAFKHALIAFDTEPAFLKAWAVLVRCFVPNIIISLLKTLGFSRKWGKWNGHLVTMIKFHSY